MAPIRKNQQELKPKFGFFYESRLNSYCSVELRTGKVTVLRIFRID